MTVASFEQNALFGSFQLYKFHLTAKYKTERPIAK